MGKMISDRMLKIIVVSFIIVVSLLGGIFVFQKVSSINTEFQEKQVLLPKTIYIGWIGPLTGAAHIIAGDNLNSVKLALSEYEATRAPNNPHIKLIVADDINDTKQSIEDYKKIVHSVKPIAIFLSAYSSVKALAKSAEKDSIILIDPIDNDATLSSLNRNVFLIAKETEQLAGIDAEAIISNGKTNTLIMYDSDDNFMTTLAKTMQEILSSTGRNSSHLKSYHSGTTDFRPFLTWAKENGIDSYVFLGYQEIGFGMKQAREMGIKDPFYSVNVITDSLLQKNSEGAINGTYFSHFTRLDGHTVKADEFINKYSARYGYKPQSEWVAMQAYDAANILISSIKQLGKDNPDIVDALRDNLLEVNEYEGVSGNITIGPNGASKGIYPSLYQIKNGAPIKETS